MKMSDSAAIYLRLSRDDGDGESDSIESQRMLLTQYAAAHQITVAAEFVDDGISGSKWERPGFQQMLQAIEDGWIGTVLVKDLSRLSRDYIRTGELIERWLPANGVRLIAVNDGLDTSNSAQQNDFSAMRAVMDDWYARDISHKVRAAIYARQRAGICTSAALPFGYARRGKTICISEPEAAYVRMIFSQYSSGMSCCGIARTLSSQKVPSPGGGDVWHDATIGRILRNQAYIGRLCLHCTQTHSYKCSKKRAVPPQEQIVYPIPRIISDALFDAVSLRMKRVTHRNTSRHWLSGKICCGVCGTGMHLTKENTQIRILCGSRKRGKDCTNPSLLLKDLIGELQKALSAYHIEAHPDILPMLVERVTVGTDQIHVFLRYQLPVLPESESSV